MRGWQPSSRLPIVTGAIYWLSNAFLRRIGMKTLGEQAPANRRLFWLTCGRRSSWPRHADEAASHQPTG
jgi:hypothetical protein